MCSIDTVSGTQCIVLLYCGGWRFARCTIFQCIIFFCSSLSHWSRVLHSHRSRTEQNAFPSTKRRVIPCQLVHSEMLPFFGILTITPLHQSTGTFPSCQHLLNSIVSSSTIMWPPSLNISTGILSNPAVLLFLRILIAIFYFFYCDLASVHWKLLLGHDSIKVLGGGCVWLIECVLEIFDPPFVLFLHGQKISSLIRILELFFIPFILLVMR